MKNDASRQFTPDVSRATGSPRSPQPDGSAHTPGYEVTSDGRVFSVGHNFTPGPWEVIADGGRSDGLWVSPPNKSEAVICDLVGRVFDGEAGCSQITAEDEANAHLIAAAPELLEALKAITEACEADCGGDATKDFGDDESVGQGDTYDMALTFGMMRRARAAIAKAEGRA